MGIGRIGWYLGRLRAMSPREIVHRLVEAGRRAAWSRRPPGWPPARDGRPFPDLPETRRGLAAAGAGGDPGFAESLTRSREGRLRLLGRDWPAYRPDAGDAFWFHDPIRGGRWPGRDVGSFRIDVRSTWPAGGTAPEGALGDVKYVWEVNRLQWLHPLAAAAAAGDRGAMARALEVLRDWCACNPPYGGVNWASGIEVALRLVGVALLCAAAGPDGLGPDDRAFLRAVVAAHGRPLAAFPSLGSSANNHRIAEGLGLLVAGLLLGPDAPGWEREGRVVLVEEAGRQILPDGVGAEQSPTYQAFTMEMLCIAALLARDAGRPLPPAVTDRLAAGAGFLVALMNRDGAVPAIGDDDEGRVLAQPPDREPRYPASVAAAVAGLTGRSDLLPPGRAPHWRDSLFGTRTLAAPAPDGGDGLRTFADGGYTVARERVAGRRAVLVFDHGPLGYLGLAAHGHADALALWLDLDGQPVLIDPGTYLYHSGREVRAALRESPAHSTLSIAGRSQSRTGGAFGWNSRARCALVHVRRGADWEVVGRHDGYRRRFGAEHERRVSRAPDGYAIHDALRGATGVTAVEIRFTLDPRLRVSIDAGDCLVADRAGPLCRLSAPAGFGATALRGSASPPLSRRFGALEDGLGLVFSGPLGPGGATTGLTVLSHR